MMAARRSRSASLFGSGRGAASAPVGDAEALFPAMVASPRRRPDEPHNLHTRNLVASPLASTPSVLRGAQSSHTVRWHTSQVCFHSIVPKLRLHTGHLVLDEEIMSESQTMVTVVRKRYGVTTVHDE
jgi:alpha-D-ribose 1-methylphosphonate 5-triphosphate synthase subunit PhnH